MTQSQHPSPPSKTFKSEKEKKTYVVTGGNGYIGSHMCQFLHRLGHEVHIVDNMSTSAGHAVHSFGKLHDLDIADKAGLKKLFQTIGPIECIFHFAARSLVAESESHPFLYYQENFGKTLALLETCCEEKIKNFVFSSTCAVFGLPQSEKMNESHPKNPINTYGHTKKLMEQMMEDLAQKKLINILIFRYFNAAGCDPQGEIGEDHLPETHLLPNMCRSYLEKKAGKKTATSFQVFGDDYPTPDGTCVRDYIHVEDLAAVHYQGSLFLNDHHGISDFNLGSEKGYSIKEVIKSFENLVGEKLSYQVVARRPGDPHSLIGDSQKAKKLLNFRPRYDLEDMLKHTLLWLEKGKSHRH